MIATVLKTGAGIKQLNEGDWVVPHKPGSEFGRGRQSPWFARRTSSRYRRI